MCCTAANVMPVALESARGRRTAGLSSDERRLYRWVLEQFAEHGHVSVSLARMAARALDVEFEQAFESFTRLDLVHSGEDEIAVAYPFSGRPTPHRVWIDDRRQSVFAMCAIDALGVAPMLNLPVEILSRDPVSGGEVWVRVDPGEGAWWEPDTSVVLDGCAAVGGPSFSSCCGVLNFFESGENGLRYLIAHEDVSGETMSMPQAIEAARAIFGEVVRGAEGVDG